VKSVLQYTGSGDERSM